LPSSHEKASGSSRPFGLEEHEVAFHFPDGHVFRKIVNSFTPWGGVLAELRREAREHSPPFKTYHRLSFNDPVFRVQVFTDRWLKDVHEYRVHFRLKRVGEIWRSSSVWLRSVTFAFLLIIFLCLSSSLVMILFPLFFDVKQPWKDFFSAMITLLCSLAGVFGGLLGALIAFYDKFS